MSNSMNTTPKSLSIGRALYRDFGLEHLNDREYIERALALAYVTGQIDMLNFVDKTLKTGASRARDR